MSSHTPQTDYPLTSSQREIWFDQALHAEVALYNVGGYIKILGPLDPALFEQAVKLLVQKHDALRTVLTDTESEDGLPLQSFVNALSISVPLQDFSGHDNAEQLAVEWMQARFNEAFELIGQPLFRYDLVKTSDTRYYWLMQYHHLIVDGHSIALLHHSLARIYTQLAQEQTPDLESPSYTHYIRDDRAYIESDKFEEQRRYWLKKYSTVPEPLLSPRYRSLFTNSLVGSGCEAFYLPRDFYQQLDSLAKQHQATLPQVLLGALYVYFTRTAQSDNFTLGWPILNRSNAQFKQTAGLFVSISPILFSFDQNLSFVELLAQILKTLRANYRYQRFPISELNREVGFKTGHSKLFDISLSYQKFDYDTEFNGIKSYCSLLWQAWEQIPLIIQVQDFHAQSDVKLDFVYNLAYFTPMDIQALQNRLMTILQAVLADSSTLIYNLPILTESETRQLIEWNCTETDYPNHQTIVTLFEEQVAKTPNQVAVVFENQQLTYRQLNDQANRLAHYLLNLKMPAGINSHNPLVAMAVERSLEMVIGLLGILKAGGAYVPIDPSYPAARIHYMLEDSAAPWLLTQSHLKAQLSLAKLEPDCVVVCLDEADFTKQPTENPLVNCQATDLAYVIYTSGSTGRPKGVMIEHGGVVNLATFQQQYFHIPTNSHILQFASLSFDAATSEVLMSLGSGATLQVVPLLKLQTDLAAILQKQAITHATLPPSAAKVLSNSNLSHLNYLIVAGEACSPELVKQWAQPGRHFINAYGPTEATVCASVFECIPNGDKPPIGCPIANTRIYILDTHHQPQPPGIPGELCIAGAGLARGYLNRPELTAEKFIEVELFGKLERIYKTGDLARWLSDGTIEYIGRLDHQVKLRGFRIELGEIEAVLSQHQAVNEVVVILSAADDNKRLVAYLTTTATANDLITELKDWLKARLPDYMIPNHFTVLDKLPLTPNGKIDRQALPDPESAYQIGVGEYVPPRSVEEELLAQIWAEVLGLEQVGIYDNFFKRGGHSLAAVKLLAKVKAAFGVQLNLQQIFDAPTVAEFADNLACLRVTSRWVEAPAPVSRANPLPITFFQEWFWRSSQNNPGSHLFHGLVQLRITGKLDRNLLQNTLVEIVHRHELLRTTYREHEGSVEQIIHAEFPVSLPLLDAMEIPGEQQVPMVNEWLREFLRQPFVPQEAPPWRATLIQLARDEFILAICLHHLIYDARSLQILSRELQTIYSAWSHNQSVPLEPLPMQYADYAYWERHILAPYVADDCLAYWREWFARGLPPKLVFSTQRPVTDADFSAGVIPWEFSPANLRSLSKVLKATHTTPPLALIAGIATLLHQDTGEGDIVIALPFADSTYSIQERLIGPTGRVLMLRLDLSSNHGFRELLYLTRRVFLEAQSRQFMTILEGMQRLGIQAKPGEVLFHFLLSYIPLSLSVAGTNLPAKKVKFDVTESHAMFTDELIMRPNLSLVIQEQETPEGIALKGNCFYRKSWFETEDAQSLVKRLQTLLEAASKL
jgi:amino acid adenylation domain-containing protein